MSQACCIGDTGTYGGNVMDGLSSFLIEGRALTYDGALFYCPMVTDDWVHGPQVIQGTGYKLKVGGRIAAQQGDICCPICGNQLIAYSSRFVLG